MVHFISHGLSSLCGFVSFLVGFVGYINFDSFSWNKIKSVRIIDMIVIVHVDVSSCGIHCG